MQVKTKAIVISALKYQEKSLIVKCFTLSDGLKSYFIPNAFSNKKTNQKIGYFQPLTVLQIEAVHKNKGTLEYIREIKLSSHYQTINTQITKSTIAIFISEILHYCIQEEEKNESLFYYLETALLWLDNHEETQNFHIYLLLGMTKYFGFYPDYNFTSNSFFNLKEGVFCTQFDKYCINELETQLLIKALLLTLESNPKIISGRERQQLLKILLEYYSLHLDGFKKPKSLEILQEVFV